MTADADELEIVALGARGDGIAEAPAGPRYVPFALPGELWRLAGDGGRAVAPPPGTRNPAMWAFRRLRRMRGPAHAGGHLRRMEARHGRAGVPARGIDAPVAPLWRIAPASRRRITLHARRQGGHVRLGFHRAATHDILDVTECAVAVPRIVAALPALREMLGPVLSGRSEAAITVLATAAGLDVHMTFTHLANPSSHYPALAVLGARQGLARLTVGNDIVLQAARPVLVFGGVGVEPPAGAFVQAVEAAQEKMVELALAAVGPAKRVADLFCGLGAFTFALARRAHVLAVDGDAAAVTALGAAARRAQGLKPVEAKVRDLFREPLGGKELQPFDAVVIDPPRQGAKAQAEQLARAKVPVVVVVSCDPGTLARDVRLLVDGGYAIDSVTPIDQFLFSAHVEAVAVLRRQRAHGAIS